MLAPNTLMDLNLANIPKFKQVTEFSNTDLRSWCPS